MINFFKKIICNYLAKIADNIDRYYYGIELSDEEKMKLFEIMKNWQNNL